MRTSKRILSLFLALVLCLSLFPAEALAEGEGSANAEQGNLSVEGASSLGTLITRTLQSEEADDAMPGVVTDIAVAGYTATVEYTVDRTADLVVAVYPDATEKNPFDIQMLGSGHTTVSSDGNQANVSISIDTMPEYFIIAAYLLDAESHEPLSTEFISRYYTAEFQAFLETTTEDYNQDLVLNLDEDETTNFLVYKEETVRVEETAGVNEITDNGDGTYTIRNADEQFLNLQPGESFSYTYEDGTILLVVAQTVTVDGTTVTVTEDLDATLENIFQYIKIEEDNSNGEGWVDTSDADPGVIYEGAQQARVESFAPASNTMFLDTWDEEVSTNAYGSVVMFDEETEVVTTESRTAAIIDETLGSSFGFSLGPEVKFGALSVICTGNVTYTNALTLKVYKSGDWFFFSLKNDYSLDVNVEIGAKVSGKIKLGEPKIPMGGGVVVSFPLYLVVEVTGKLTVGITIKGGIGFSYDTDYGFKNLSSWPTTEAKFELSGKIFIGFEAEFQVSFAIKKLVSTGISLKAGVEVTGKLKGYKYEYPSASKVHDCAYCIEGSTKIKITATLKFDALWGIIKLAPTLADLSFKVWDFYRSVDFDEFEFGTCPHVRYKTNITVLGLDKEPVKGAIVRLPEEDDFFVGITDDNGAAGVFLANGKHVIQVTNADGLTSKATITVEDGPKNCKIIFPNEYGDMLAQGECGKDLSWMIFEDGTLAILGTGAMDNYDISAGKYSPWYEYYSVNSTYFITRVILGEGVTGIGNEAFKSCVNLKEVRLPSTLERVGDGAFQDCVSWYVNDIDLPDGLSYIGAYAFSCCSFVGKLVIPDMVTSIGEKAFAASSTAIRRLTEVVLPDDLTSIGDGAFMNCKFLETINLPDKLQHIGAGAFQGCTSLSVDLVIPSGVASLEEGVFENCGALTTVVLPDGLTSIGDYAFYKCSGLQSCEIPDGVERIGAHAFADCYYLEPRLPGNLRAIGDYAFYGAFQWSGVTELTIPSSLTIIPTGAFRACGLTKVNLPNTLTRIGAEAFYANNLTELDIPASVKKVGGHAFSYNAMTKLTIPSTVEEWEWYVFEYCAELKEISLPGSLEVLAPGFFRYCTALTSVVIPEGITLVSGTFEGCTSLQKVTLPSTLDTITNRAFHGCASLKQITLPDSLTSIGYESFAFAGLTSLVVPEGVTYIGGIAFQDCASLTEITLPKSLTKIEERAFAGYNALTDVYYQGTESQWDAIYKVSFYLDATIHYLGTEEAVEPQSLAPVGTLSLPEAVEAPLSEEADGAAPEAVVPVEDAALPQEETQEEAQPAPDTPEAEPEAPAPVEEAEAQDAALAESAEAPEDDAPQAEAPAEEAEAEALAAAPMAAFAGTSEDGAQVKLAHFSALAAGRAYVLLVTASADETALLESSNLLYIAQGTADDAGTMTLSYIPRQETSGAVVRAYGPSNKNLADAVITVEQFSDGSFDVTVVYAGETLAEDKDYLLTLDEDETTVTVTVRGRGDYTGTQTVEGYRFCIVQFDANGGTGEMAALKVEAGNYTLPECKFTAPEGKTFVGWKLGADTEVKDAGTQIEVSSDVTVTATWKYNDSVLVKGAQAVLDGTLAIRFTFTVPASIAADQEAYVEIIGSGRCLDIPLAQASIISGSDYGFEYRMAAKEYRDMVTVKLYDGNGQQITLKGSSGTDYTEGGLEYSLYTYVSKMQARQGVSEKMLAMANGIDAYCTAAQLYFGYKTEGLSMSEAVSQVDAANLAGFKGVFEGSLPTGITNRAIQLELVSDTKLRLVLFSDSSIDASDYRFEVNGTEVHPARNADGSYYLDVLGIAAADLDVVQTFSVEYGGVSYTVKASAMTYARASVQNGNEVRQNLGRALYLYNTAANAYFGR